MVNFTIDQVRNMMEDKHKIRNISVIAHVDHGKSTLTDSLVSKAGIIAKAKAGEARFTDTRADEQERSITIKSTSISMYYKYNNPETKAPEEYLINLIDSPGHVDFSSEVTAALRVTDGALVVVDCVEGVCIQTETVLQQAVSERIRPILFLNKLDRVFFEQQTEFEEAYQNFRKIIESVNAIISTYKDVDTPVQVNPTVNNVGFGSGAHAWGFTIGQFAEKYAKAGGKSVEWYTERLWGDYFYNPKKKTWSKKRHSPDYVRGFCHFIMKPIKRFLMALTEGKKPKIKKIIEAMAIKTESNFIDNLEGKELMKAYMRSWLPAGDALLTMIVKHIPSPAEAQKYRFDNLYTGPMNDRYALSIKNCDSEGPLVLFVSKMVPANEKGKFYAFARVFSGTIASGQRVRIIGPNYNPETKTDVATKNVQRTTLMMGRYVEQIVDVPAGNVVGLVGLDDVILKSATVVNDTSIDAFPIKSMKFSVSPVVSVAVEPENTQDLPKIVEGLKKLSKSDPLVTCSMNNSGQHVISGAGELHIEICLKDLRDFVKGAKIRESDPIVNFCETITEESPSISVSKSPNKHNRLYMRARPLDQGICDEIENNTITPNMDGKVLAKKLSNDYDWDLSLAKKIWSFGSFPKSTANLLVDGTKGVQFLHEIKDHVKGAFLKATLAGILCEESMRSCVFQITDATLHADAIHRGAGQIMPAARRAFCACQIISGPGILEPVYLVEITVPDSFVSAVYNVLTQNRGVVEEETRNASTPMMRLKCFLPVMESIGFVAKLRQATSGKAFAQMSFSHWSQLSGNVYDEGSKANKVVIETRKRKGLSEILPKYVDFHDKIQ